MLADLNPGLSSSSPDRLRAAGGSLFFSADTPGVGTEPWVSAGTSESTRLVGDFVPGPRGSSLRDVASTARGTVLALDDRGAHRDGPWTGTMWSTTTTGAATGKTTLLSSGPELSTGARAFGRDALVLASSFGDDGSAQLWRTDGTSAGTRLVKGGLILGTDLVPAGTRAFFLDAQNPLMVTDGTTAGTHRVYRWPDGPFGSTVVFHMTAVGDRAYFEVDSQYKIGAEMWVSSGTHAGTHLLKDINPGPASAWPHRLRRWRGNLYFIARDGRHGPEVWRTDGSTAGTVRLTDVSADVRNLTACRGRLYFTTAIGDRAGLWATDGRRGREQRITTLPGRRHEEPAGLTCLPAGLVFTAADGEHGRELWTLAAGATQPVLHDLRPGPRSSTPASVRRVGATVFLTAGDGVHGREVWTVTF
jgi:ELWxxDGT repeat protein